MYIKFVFISFVLLVLFTCLFGRKYQEKRVKNGGKKRKCKEKKTRRKEKERRKRYGALSVLLNNAGTMTFPYLAILSRDQSATFCLNRFYLNELILEG
jgi:hypothetical protein